MVYRGVSRACGTCRRRRKKARKRYLYCQQCLQFPQCDEARPVSQSIFLTIDDTDFTRVTSVDPGPKCYSVTLSRLTMPKLSHVIDVPKPISYARDIETKQMSSFGPPIQMIDKFLCRCAPGLQLKPFPGRRKPFYKASKMCKSNNVPWQRSFVTTQQLPQIGRFHVAISMVYSPSLERRSPRARYFRLPP